MGGLGRICPDDITLEEYLYQDLSCLDRVRVRLHLAVCPMCRERLQGLRRFSRCLLEVPLEEPPREFMDDLVRAMDSWGVPTPAASGEDEQAVDARVPSLRVRWALGVFLFVVSTVLQWQYADQLPHYMSGSYLSNLKGLGSLWDSIVSGALWQNTVQVFAAIRTDGLSALEILGSTLPTQIAGVIVFGGIVTAVFISHIRASRRRGEGHR